MTIHKWKLAALLAGAIGLTAGSGLAVAMQFGGVGFSVSGRRTANAPQRDRAALENQAEKVKDQLSQAESRKTRLEKELQEVEGLIESLQESLSQIEATLEANAADGPEADDSRMPEAPAEHHQLMRARRQGMGPMDPSVMVPGMGFPGRPDASGLQTAMSGKIIAVSPRETDKVAAYSTETGKWASYTVPEDLTATPILNSELMALHLEGDAISEIAVFDAKSGRWHSQKLEEPISGLATPILSDTLAVYALGRRVYAYSPEANRWGTLTLPEEADEPVPIAHAALVLVEHGGKLHTFSAKTGRWTEFDTRKEESR